MKIRLNHIVFPVLGILLTASLVLMIVLTVSVLKSPSGPEPPKDETGTAAETDPPSSGGHASLLEETPDAGQAYQDSLIFVGDSTTAHLRSRGVLSGGTETKQVWCPENNTLLLTSQITSLEIVYPDTGESMTIPAAAGLKKPAYIVFTIGINGVTSSVKNKDDFLYNYGKLTKAVAAASPETAILIQSVFPVASNCDAFSKTPAEVNADIRTLNAWLLEFADENGYRYLDTHSALADDGGMLPVSYQNGDGIHLTAEAYNLVLQYIRTHACPK